MRDVVAATALNAALALPVYTLVRRLLGDLLPGDPRRRRRRAYMTGGLQPDLPRLRKMLELQADRRPPITPQLALRVAILGGVALAMFAVIFFRLWYLQVLSGDRYVAQANDNQVRDIIVPAPRGDIIDRNGNVLVENRRSIAVQVEPRGLPAPGPKRADLYRRLGCGAGSAGRRPGRARWPSRAGCCPTPT